MNRIALLLTLLLTSCQYKLGDQSLISCYKTITIPYVVYDPDGTLTSEIAYAISQSTPLEYRKSGGDLVLNVTMIEYFNDRIGFRFDKDGDGKIIKDRLIPAEERITAIFEISVTECGTSACVIPPTRLEARVDFDHDYYATKSRPVEISLGQLDDIDVAKEVAGRNLNRAIAQRIVEYIANDFSVVQ